MKFNFIKLNPPILKQIAVTRLQNDADYLTMMFFY
jgi:hypothetical protein